MTDPHKLQRFVEAQSGTYDQVRAELQRGRKTSHWIWFIFPQIAGLGQSSMAVRYAIASLEEARAYLEHPVLAPRLRECCRLLLAHRGASITQIMGYPDDLKLKSSMTLFSAATDSATGKSVEDAVFSELLATFFDGELDPLTLARL